MKAFVFESEIPLSSKEHEIDCALDGDMSIVIDRGNEIFSNSEFNNSKFKVCVLRESFPWSHRDSWALNNQSKFDLFITTQKSVIDKLKKPCLFVPFATSWVDPIKDLPTKKFMMSYMPGKKLMREFEGHAVRRALYDTMNNNSTMIRSHVPVPIELFHPDKWVDKKETIFDEFQFSVIIENVISEGWFTEKLLDCMLRKTIPVYRGAPDIGEIFDDKAILSFTNIEGFLTVCAGINEDTYHSLNSSIEKNYEIALSFLSSKDFEPMFPDAKTMNTFNSRALIAAVNHFL